MSTLVALLSLTATIMVATSRNVILVTPGVSPFMMSLSGTRSDALHRIDILQLQFAALRLAIQLDQHCNFDRTGGGKHFVRAQENFRIRIPEINDGNAHDTIKAMIHTIHGGIELVPENLLFDGMAFAARWPVTQKE